MFDMPYGYYQLLRVGVCVVSAMVAYRAYEASNSKLAWTFAVSALIYNPIAPLALGRELWTFVNLATIGALIWGLVSLQSHKAASR